ncbi:hypothetical protein ACLK19_20075 [Escherichia coli]
MKSAMRQYRDYRERGAAWVERRRSTRLDTPGKIDPIPHPYGEDLRCADNKPVAPKKQEAKAVTVQPPRPKPWGKTYVLLPSFEKVKGDKVLYAHASRILHHETNPRCARAFMKNTVTAMCGIACYPAFYRRDGQRFCAAGTSACHIRPMAMPVFRLNG